MFLIDVLIKPQPFGKQKTERLLDKYVLIFFMYGHLCEKIRLSLNNNSNKQSNRNDHHGLFRPSFNSGLILAEAREQFDCLHKPFMTLSCSLFSLSILYVHVNGSIIAQLYYT